MDAGRELDALVAEKVMARPIIAKDIHGEPFAVGGRIPAYSTDMAAAWAVAAELRQRKMQLSLQARDYIAEAEFIEGILSHGRATAATAPHAICLAALIAVGVEVAPTR